MILEAWLDARVHQPNIYLHEKTVIVAVKRRSDLMFDVLLDDDSTCNVHYIILATGYQPNMHNVAFLSA